MSLPVRGAWIEIVLVLGYVRKPFVAPLTGSNEEYLMSSPQSCELVNQANTKNLNLSDIFSAVMQMFSLGTRITDVENGKSRCCQGRCTNHENCIYSLVKHFRAAILGTE